MNSSAYIIIFCLVKRSEVFEKSGAEAPLSIDMSICRGVYRL